MFKTRKNNYSEKEIVDGCVRNERFFQELLYRKYFEKMIAMCMRYTDDRDIGMEIVNNGFLRVFKKLNTFSFKGSLEGWIRKLVYHSLSEYFKKHSKYLQFLVFEEHDTSVNANALTNMYEEDLLKMVDTLPPSTRQVFQLYAIEGFNHPEIAKQLSISVGTSKWHLANAREKLKKLIEQNANFKLHAG